MADEENFEDEMEDSLKDTEENDEIDGSEEGTAKKKRKRKQVSRKIVDEWSDEFTTKLISEVEQYNCIWDARDVEYKNKTSRESAWRLIAESFDGQKTVPQLNLKWQTLRNQFRNVANVAKKTKSGQGAVRAPNWKYYSHLSFIAAAEREQNVGSVSNLCAVSERNIC